MLGFPLSRATGSSARPSRRTDRAGIAAEDIALLTAFGHHAAVALENSRLYDESRRALQELREAYATIEAAVAVHESLTRMVLAGGDVGDVADLLVDALGGSVLVSIAPTGSSQRTVCPRMTTRRRYARTPNSPRSLPLRRVWAGRSRKAGNRAGVPRC